MLLELGRKTATTRTVLLRDIFMPLPDAISADCHEDQRGLIPARARL
jgi:hypothetical protein